MKRKIYKFQIIYLIFSTLTLALGILGVIYHIYTYYSICMIIAGLGLDTTVIVSIFEKKKQ